MRIVRTDEAMITCDEAYSDRLAISERDAVNECCQNRCAFHSDCLTRDFEAERRLKEIVTQPWLRSLWLV